MYYYDVCKSDHINVYDVCKERKRKGAENWLGTRLGCCQIERIAIFCTSIFHIFKMIVNFWQKSLKKKKLKKKTNLPFLDKRTRREKWMRAGALRQDIFFSLINFFFFVEKYKHSDSWKQIFWELKNTISASWVIDQNVQNIVMINRLAQEPLGLYKF